MAAFKEAEEYGRQNSFPPYPYSELGAAKSSAQVRAAGSSDCTDRQTNAQPNRKEGGDLLLHTLIPQLQFILNKNTAQSPPQHSLMGQR